MSVHETDSKVYKEVKQDIFHLLRIIFYLAFGWFVVLPIVICIGALLFIVVAQSIVYP